MKVFQTLFILAFIGFSMATENTCTTYVDNFVAKQKVLKDKISNVMYATREISAQFPSIPAVAIRRFYVNALKLPSSRVCSEARTTFGDNFLTAVITLPTYAALGRVVENINIGSTCGDRIAKFREYPPLLSKVIIERTKSRFVNYLHESYAEVNLLEIRKFVPRVFSKEAVNQVCATGRRLFSMDNTLACRRTVMKFRATYKTANQGKKFKIGQTIRSFLKGRFPQVPYNPKAQQFLDVFFKGNQDALAVCKSFKSTFGREWNIPADLIDHL
eukprot:gene2600-3560_t